MYRPLIDRLSDPVRRTVMVGFMSGCSYGVLVVAGGWQTALASFAFFGLATARAYIHIHAALIDKKIKQKETLLEAGERRFAPVSDQLKKITADLAANMGISENVRIFTNRDTNETQPAIVTPDNCILFNRQAMAFLKREEKKFVLAHELAHIRAGDLTQNISLSTSIRLHEKFLTAWASAVCAHQITGIGVIGAAGIGGVSLGASFLVSKFIEAAEQRSMERRRDADALMETGDLGHAISGLRKVERLRGSNQFSLWQRLFYSHPVGESRVHSLEIAYRHYIRNAQTVGQHPVESTPQTACPAMT